jgi:hypothetical protein
MDFCGASVEVANSTTKKMIMVSRIKRNTPIARLQQMEEECP